MCFFFEHSKCHHAMFSKSSSLREERERHVNKLGDEKTKATQRGTGMKRKLGFGGKRLQIKGSVSLH